MISIDGSRGEGGGQILRTSLGLSLLTGTPVRLFNIRAGRRKPGLMRQHLTAVEAAARVGSAQVEGAALKSQEVVFRPQGIQAGHYAFKISTAGSATLVLQTVLPALLAADGPSTLVLEGGTHNMKAPPFDFLKRSFLPILERMGPRIDAQLERHGFYPAGGGRMVIDITPAPLQPIELHARGAIVARRARALVAHLPRHIAERELQSVGSRLNWSPTELHVEEITDSAGPGNVLFIEVETEHVTAVFTGFGRKRMRAEQVAVETADEAKRWLAHGAPVGEHLADQLMLPLALAGGGGFTTGPPSLHATTQIETLGLFLDVPMRFEQADDRQWRFEVG
ncbi:MAG: RNA 3'-terminal phosphate cyclase (ATP) [Bradymonadia bacterium]|jgi:RNA 3'-terminal phosphate cyclase (ATP)